IDNQLQYQASSDNYSMQLKQFYDGNEYHIIATGNIGDRAPKYLKPSIDDINGYLIVLTEHLVKELGANYAAINTTTSSNAVKAEMVKRITSPKLNDMLKQALHDSNNLVTESMYVKLGEITAPRARDWRHIGVGNKKLLETHLNIKLDQTDIYDGSGISHYHLTSADDINKLLASIYRSPELYKKVTANMPDWCKKEGNLKYLPKLHKASNKVKVYAKTGTTSQIANVAGFIELPNRAPIVFTFMSFNHPENKKKIKQLYAGIIDLIVDYYSNNKTA
ncbi:MAG: D-alanyl-D-alanine carboxypeptidase, partial [Pseudomonadota bacterium]